MRVYKFPVAACLDVSFHSKPQDFDESQSSKDVRALPPPGLQNSAVLPPSALTVRLQDAAQQLQAVEAQAFRGGSRGQEALHPAD